MTMPDCTRENPCSDHCTASYTVAGAPSATVEADIALVARQQAVFHADAIWDTGDGYSVQRLARGWWRIDCLWCEWNDRGTTKGRAVERYRQHEATILAVLRENR
jgi:hypothetical protein